MLFIDDKKERNLYFVYAKSIKGHEMIPKPLEEYVDKKLTISVF
jgi:hypothetical protein